MQRRRDDEQILNMDDEHFSNEELLASLGYPPESEEYHSALSRMRTYGNNRWWASPDPCVRAYWRTEEWHETGGLLLQEWKQYRADLAMLTGRTLPDEFLHRHDDVRAIARVAYANYLKSRGRLDERETLCRNWPSEETALILFTEAAFAERGMHFFPGGEWAIADILDPEHLAKKRIKTPADPDTSQPMQYSRDQQQREEDRELDEPREPH